MTLYELRQADGAVRGECLDCGRGRDIPATHDSLVRLSGDLEVRAVGRRFKCRDCGGKRILTQVADDA